MSDVAGRGDASAASGAHARADALLDLRRPEEAATVARQGLAAAPDDVALWLVLGWSLHAARDNAGAREAAERAIALAPWAGEPYRLLAVVHLAGRRRPAALAAARAAMANAPDDPASLVVLARAQEANRQPKDADITVQQAVALAPEWAPAQAAVGFHALERKRWRAAEDALRRAVELDPTNPDYLNNLGVAVGRLGRAEEAMELFEAAARLEPRQQLPRENLARTAQRFVGGGALLLFLIRPVGALIGLAYEVGGDILGGLASAAVGVLALLFVVRSVRRRAALSPATRGVLREHRRLQRRLGWGVWALILVTVLAFTVCSGAATTAEDPRTPEARVLLWMLIATTAVFGALTVFSITRLRAAWRRRRYPGRRGTGRHDAARR